MEDTCVWSLILPDDDENASLHPYVVRVIKATWRTKHIGTKRFKDATVYDFDVPIALHRTLSTAVQTGNVDRDAIDLRQWEADNPDAPKEEQSDQAKRDRIIISLCRQQRVEESFDKWCVDEGFFDDEEFDRIDKA